MLADIDVDELARLALAVRAKLTQFREEYVGRVFEAAWHAWNSVGGRDLSLACQDADDMLDALANLEGLVEHSIEARYRDDPHTSGAAINLVFIAVDEVLRFNKRPPQP